MNGLPSMHASSICLSRHTFLTSELNAVSVERSPGLPACIRILCIQPTWKGCSETQSAALQHMLKEAWNELIFLNTAFSRQLSDRAETDENYCGSLRGIRLYDKRFECWGKGVCVHSVMMHHAVYITAKRLGMHACEVDRHQYRIDNPLLAS